MRMEDFSKAFPKKVNIDQYQPIIDAALKAGKGDDGLPRVVVDEFMTQQLATRAANAIRNHVRAAKLTLKVSCQRMAKRFLFTSRAVRPERAPRRTLAARVPLGNRRRKHSRQRL